MFFAHLPAGYLLTRGLLSAGAARKLPEDERSTLMGVGLVASVLPDADLLWHYLAADWGVSHRAYWTHAPFFWVVVATTVALLAWALLDARLHRLNLIVLANVLLHLALDTVAAPVRWLFPFSNEYFEFVTVPRLPGPWYLSFLKHWTMLLEVAIATTALAVWRYASMTSAMAATPLSEGGHE